MCSTLELHREQKKQKKLTVFLLCCKVGGCLERVHVSGGRGLRGVSEGGGVI